MIKEKEQIAGLHFWLYSLVYPEHAKTLKVGDTYDLSTIHVDWPEPKQRKK